MYASGSLEIATIEMIIEMIIETIIEMNLGRMNNLPRIAETCMQNSHFGNY